MSVAGVLVGVLSGLPGEPVPRDEAAEEARRELSKQIYQREKEPFFIEYLGRILDWIESVLNRAGNASPGGGFGLLVFVLFVAAVLGFVIWRFGLPARRAKVTAPADVVTPTRSARDHTERADALAAEGRWPEAVRERLRAIIAGLVSRGVIDNRPGRTATEVAAAAGRTLPGAAADLSAAAALFGEVWYGRRPATAEHDERMRTLAARIAEATPATAATQGQSDSWVVPGAPAPVDAEPAGTAAGADR